MRYRGETSDQRFSAFCEDMKGLIQKFCSIQKELPVIKEEGDDVQVGASVPAVGSSTASASSSSSSGKDGLVGLDEHVTKIKGLLTIPRSNLLILPIVGMGGIGKTTLAKAVFDDKFIVDHFHIRIWLTISQEFNVKQILKGFLDEDKNKESCESLAELGDRLYKKLFGKKYLLVMDDVWTIKSWDDLRRFFPNNEIGSRIMLTTRMSDMAASVGTYNPYSLTFLDKNNSWNLFCHNAFGLKSCPHANLEKFAKDILKSCRGLPLAIVVVSRLLANSNMTVEYWKSIAENISSFSNFGDEENCLKILSLSYKSLPIHLKPCFLYMRVFPEDYYIYVSDLIECWISEGFIKPVKDKYLEDTALEYVRYLIDRNLIFRSVEENGFHDGERCGVHDLLRDLCLRESNHEKFIQSPKVQQVTSVHEGTCFLCMEQIHVGHRRYLVPIYQSLREINLTCDACKRRYSHITRSIIVRTIVIRAREDHIKSTIAQRDEIGQPTELRSASIHFIGVLKFVSPPTMHLLWNLLILRIYSNIMPNQIVLPSHIWEMPQLRYIGVLDALLLDPIATCIEGEGLLVLNNLQTLYRVKNFKLTKKILDRIPNLRKLEIYYSNESKEGMEWSNYSLSDLAQLQKLESLSVRVHRVVVENITFPNSLKQLCLFGYKMTWTDMSILGLLPSLERLELLSNIEGSEWNLIEDEFLQLKELSIRGSDLVYWRADTIPFPILERLVLYSFKLLEEIPLGIGDIQTLQSIKLDICSDSAINSAKKIWEEQHEMGHEIRIEVTDYYKLSYQIGPFTARETETACASLAYLKNVLDNLEKVAQRGHGYLNTKQMETVKEDAHFLQGFLDVHCQGKIQELESLSRQIAQVARKARFVIDGLQRHTADPIRDKNLPEDVERLLEKMEFIKKELSVTRDEAEHIWPERLLDKMEIIKKVVPVDIEEAKHVQARYPKSYDIESLKISNLRCKRITDEDLRYYQIGSVTARMTEAASVSWGNLADTRKLLQKAAEMGRLHLNTKQMETIEEAIDFLDEVVEVHPESKSQEMESLSSEITDVVNNARRMSSRLWRLWPGNQGGITGEEVFAFSEDVERVIEKIDLMKEQLSVDKEEAEGEEDVQVGNQRVDAAATHAGEDDSDSLGQSQQATKNREELQCLSLLTGLTMEGWAQLKIFLGQTWQLLLHCPIISDGGERQDLAN